MKYSELHRKVRRNGWKLIRVEGSHYIYEKNGIHVEEDVIFMSGRVEV
jgi:predicted RNA binding protein YcfA (HicA-like mRNA interferase family)